MRRGLPGWSPPPPDARRDAEVWTILRRMGRTLHRASPVGVRLRGSTRQECVAKAGQGVTVVGEPGELLLQAFGNAAVEVEIEGAAADVAAFGGAARGGRRALNSSGLMRDATAGARHCGFLGTPDRRWSRRCPAWRGAA